MNHTLQAQSELEMNDLLSLACAGDTDAGSKLFAGHAPRLYRTALHVLGTHEDAEDAVQNGMLSAWRNLKRFEGRAKFSTWLTRIVVNEALQEIRRTRTRAVTSLDEASGDSRGEPLANSISDPRPNPEEKYAEKEMTVRLHDKLKVLPELYRSVVQLRDVEGLTTRKVSEILGVPAATLKSRLYRGRQMLLKVDIRRNAASTIQASAR